MPIHFDTVSQGESTPKLRIAGTKEDLIQFAEELKRQAANSADGQRDPLRFDDTELRSHEFDVEIRALTTRDLASLEKKGARRKRLTLIIWLVIVGATIALFYFAPAK